MNKKEKDPFGFEDKSASSVKKEYTKDELRAFEKNELTPYLCKVGDKDYNNHLEWLRETFVDLVKAQIMGKNQPVLLASAQTKAELERLLAKMPQMAKISPLSVPEGSDTEMVIKLEKEQSERIQEAREAYKGAVKDFIEKCQPELARIAQNNVVGELCESGRMKFLKAKNLIGFYRDGDFYIRHSNVYQYVEMELKLKAYDKLVSSRHYARQMSLSQFDAASKQINKSMKA